MEVTVKKQNIVKKSQDFNRIIKKRQGKVSKYFIINTEENNDNIPKFGITFTKHIGNAVTRNKLKRRIKSVIDNNKEAYQPNKNYIIIAKKEILELPFQEISKELIYLLNKIKGENNAKKK